MIHNKFVTNGNEIYVYAPGNANSNKLKNELIWDINNALSEDLHLFWVSKRNHHGKSLKSILESCYSPKINVVFSELDQSLLKPKAMNKEDILNYKKLVDPKGRIEDDVFFELCCLENVDIEYIATQSPLSAQQKSISFRSVSSYNKWLISSFPVYVSLFGATEMRIIINDPKYSDLVITLVEKHCERAGVSE